MKKYLFLLAGMLALGHTGAEAKSFKLGRSVMTSAEKSGGSFAQEGAAVEKAECDKGQVYNPVIKKCVAEGCSNGGMPCRKCVETKDGSYCAQCDGEAGIDDFPQEFGKGYLSPTDGRCYDCGSGPEMSGASCLCKRTEQTVACAGCDGDWVLKGKQCLPPDCGEGEVYHIYLHKCIPEGCDANCTNCGTDTQYGDGTKHFCQGCKKGWGMEIQISWNSGAYETKDVCTICPENHYTPHFNTQNNFFNCVMPGSHAGIYCPGGGGLDSCKSCKSAIEGCKYCEYSGKVICSQCQDGYNLENNACVLSSECPEGQVYNPTPGIERCVGQNGCNEEGCGNCQGDGESAYCASCNPGFFMYDLGGYCKYCEPGTYNPNPGLIGRDCISCPAGTYTDEFQRVDCLPCPPGTFSSTERANSINMCTSCQAGQFSNAGSTSCSSCGSLINGCAECDYEANDKGEKGKLFCVACADGFISDGNGGCVENSCPKGQALNAVIDRCVPAGCDSCKQNCATDDAGAPYCSGCGNTSYINYEDGQCHTCSSAIENCETCTSDKGKVVCETCAYGYDVSDGQCVAPEADFSHCPGIGMGCVTDGLLHGCPGDPNETEVCKQCEYGYEQTPNYKSCQPCAKGEFSSGIYSSSCRSCEYFYIDGWGYVMERDEQGNGTTLSQAAVEAYTARCLN